MMEDKVSIHYPVPERSFRGLEGMSSPCAPFIVVGVVLSEGSCSLMLSPMLAASCDLFTVVTFLRFQLEALLFTSDTTAYPDGLHPLT